MTLIAMSAAWVDLASPLNMIGHVVVAIAPELVCVADDVDVKLIVVITVSEFGAELYPSAAEVGME